MGQLLRISPPSKIGEEFGFRLPTPILFGVFASGCYTLGKSDIFEVAFQSMSAATLTGLSGQDHQLRTLNISVTRFVSAYWDDGDNATAC